MAKIVLGLASVHSPHVSTAPELWELHAERDRHNPSINMPKLQAERGGTLVAELEPDVYREKYDRCNAAIDKLSASLHEAKPDVVIVIGDDQREMFLDDGIPAFAIYRGDSIVDIPALPGSLDPSIEAAMWARHHPGGEVYRCNGPLATHLIDHLNEAQFDITQMARQAQGRGLGHAFTFVRIRLMREHVVPMVPIFVNCFYSPNQPTPKRCYAFGQELGRAIAAWPEETRVAIVASGGLSHFVIDEQIDRDVMEALVERRPEKLIALPAHKLVSGTSEIRNWIIAAGAMEHLQPEIVDYTASYRSLSGTGCGMGFARWN